MRRCLHFLVWFVALSLVAVSCRVDSSVSVVREPLPSAGDESGELTTAQPTPFQPATAQPTTVQPTTVQPTAVPEPTEVPSLSSNDQVAAAMAEFDANPVPAETETWDLIEAEFLDDRVRLEVCVWNGASIFESRHLAEYSVESTDSGAQANLNFDNPLLGTCRSQPFIDSLFAALREYDDYWRTVLENPESFDRQTALQFMSEELIDFTAESRNEWIADALTWRGPGYDGQLPSTAVMDLLWRRYETEAGSEVVEVVACRDMEADFGLYQGDQLVDDFIAGEPGGESLVVYTVGRRDGNWVVQNIERRSWADCIGFGDGWLDAINEWKPDPIVWQVVPDE